MWVTLYKFDLHSHLQLNAEVAFPVVIRILKIGPSRCCLRNVAPIHSSRAQGKALPFKAGHIVCELLINGGYYPLSHHVLADSVAHKPSDDAACVTGHPKLTTDCGERAASCQAVESNGKTFPAASVILWPRPNVARNLTVQIFKPAVCTVNPQS